MAGLLVLLLLAASENQTAAAERLLSESSVGITNKAANEPENEIQDESGDTSDTTDPEQESTTEPDSGSDTEKYPDKEITEKTPSSQSGDDSPVNPSGRTSDETSKTDTPVADRINVVEIDLGDYNDTMSVGERQLLVATVLPINADNQTITYASSDARVAMVNTMGRIIAMSEGSAIVSATCDGITAQFTLTVKPGEEEEEPKKEVSEIDLGDYQDVMGIGEKQLLSVTVLPFDAPDHTIYYNSSNKDVASINGAGRITALQIGTTQITASCGAKSASFSLTVQEESADFIAVTAIEISDHEDEVEVDETINLSVKVLPEDATRQTVHYTSSDTSIATVNSSGEIKGVRKGNVIIYVSAGDVMVEVPISVVVATTRIRTNSDYLVLRPGESFQLTANVTPVEAIKTLTYKSGDSSVAEVSSSGLVKAKGTGATTIIVSNEDNAIAIPVIVNESLHADDVSGQRSSAPKSSAISYDKVVYAAKTEVIPEDQLLYLYEEGEKLLIIGGGYNFTIDGRDIVNYKNTLRTDIELEKQDEEISFCLNQSDYLPGPIILHIDEWSDGYLYLYNPAKSKYTLVQSQELNNMLLTSAGEYLITRKPVRAHNAFVFFALLFAAISLASGMCIYIILRRKYWFW